MAEDRIDSVHLCEETLNTWGDKPYYDELLRTLFYLTQAHYQLNRQDQGYAAAEKWAGILKDESPRCVSILLCIRTITSRQQGKLGEAVEL